MNIKSFSSDHKRVLALTLLVAFIYELILSFQGFDLCDEGYVLTSYQQIFKCPSSVEYLLLYYLAGIVGGIWNIIFGFGGILSFRFLTIIVLLLIIYFTSLSMKKIIAPIMIPVAVSLVLIFSNRGIVVFSHNHLTALLVAIAIYFLLKGLNGNRPWYVFTGAMFCGINIFARIPNIALLALGLLLFIDYAYNKNIKLLGRNILMSIAGLVTGIGAVFLLMFSLGHLPVFIDTINNLFVAGSGDDSAHNIGKLANDYLTNYQEIYIYLSIFVFTLAFFSFIYRFYKDKWKKTVVVILYCFIATAFSLFVFNCTRYYSLILFPIILSCYFDRKNKPIILINAASLVVLFFMPLGTDTGILNTGHSTVWLATFAATAHVYRFIRFKMQKNDNSYRLFIILFYILFCARHLYVMSINAYFDPGARWEKRYRAHNDKFTVFTSKEKAQAMDVLLTELNKYVRKDDYLLCFESLPMLHYLTETRPYIGNPWTWSYDSDNFILHLKKSAETIPLPVVVRQKCQTIGGQWLTPVPIAEQIGATEPYLYKDKGLHFFEKFLEDNRYTIVWENDLFQIYLPHDFHLQ